MNYLISTLLATACITAALAQYDGPPRLNIGPVRIHQGGRVLPGPGGPALRLRRPAAKPVPLNALPIPTARAFSEPHEAKPVTEEPEDDILETFVPHIVSTIAPAPQHSTPQFSLPEEHEEIQQNNIVNRYHAQVPQQQPHRIALPESNAQRFAPSVQEKPAPQVRTSQRQIYREQRPQYEEVVEHNNKPRFEQQRPHQKTADHHQQQREKKPVAQILRKYREEHEDGSITWGYENDDGSFKEEIIGIDCVTRGRYGYIDPEGNKKEYSYETGILCDPNKRDQEEDEETTGYIDYQENKAVLPNGVQIDLANMGKNKSKRPAPQYYRN